MQADQITLDFDQLKMLSGDDDEFMIEILEMIVDQSPQIIAQMNQLYAAAEFITLGSTAHLYKSTVTILGNQEINGLLKEIENTANQTPDPDQLFPLMEQFRMVSNAILTQVEEELNTLK